MSKTPEMVELRKAVEEKYKKPLRTTTDFERFTRKMEKEYGEQISTATMKRLWDYVSDQHKPRESTLDILARYVGYDDYQKFCAWLKTTPNYASSFFQADQLMSSELKPGQKITIGWSPNRTVLLAYLGESTYEVLSSENSKMQPGDRFLCGSFIKGTPLYISTLERNGQQTPPYVAGRNGGLTVIQSEE